MAEIIEFEWFPEPLVVAGQIDNMAAALEQLSVPLEYSLPQVQAAIARHFDEEGPGWPYWSDSYAPFAESHNEGILVQSGDLRDAATSSEALAVTGDSIVWTGAGVPDTWEFHEFGAPDRQTRSGASNSLPQRQFIGLDTEAETAITAIFLAWLDRIVAGEGVSIAPVGRFGTRLRGAGGRFVPGGA